MLNKVEIIDATGALKGALCQAHAESGQGGFRPFETIDIIEAAVKDLPPGCRYSVRYRGAVLSIMGWRGNLVGDTATQRGGLNEGPHTFHGIDFVFDPDSYLSLRAGKEPSSPWCRLSFSHTTGDPGFGLAILPPGTTINRAQFV